MRYILHIGLPKTGSTSLQVALAANREVLRRHGLTYPETGIGGANQAKHIGLSMVLNGAAPGDVGMTEDWIERFRTETAGTDTCILSSESFSRLEKPEVVTSLIPRDRTLVVMYVREPVMQIASFYKERVRVANMTMSFREFAGYWHPPYFSVAEKWASVFGKENILIRLNRRDDGPWNIVSDFANLIGMELNDAFPIRGGDMNWGIAGNLLFVKRILNFFITRKEIRPYRGQMRDLACLDSSFHGKIPVDQETIDLIARRTRKELEHLQCHFGLQVKPCMKPVEAPPCPEHGNLGRDFARILTASREKEMTLAPLLMRIAEFFPSE